GGGTTALRKQLRFLRQIISKTDFIHMRPANELFEGNLPAGVTARVLTNPGREYLIYLRTPAAPQPKGECSHQRFQHGEVRFDLTLPGGNFVADWLDAKRGVVLRTDRLIDRSAPPAFVAPAFEDDIAIYVHRRGSKQTNSKLQDPNHKPIPNPKLQSYISHLDSKRTSEAELFNGEFRAQNVELTDERRID